MTIYLCLVFCRNEGKSRRKTLSQYFRLKECPSCRTQTNDVGLCRSCKLTPSDSAVQIEVRCRETERKYDFVTRMCRYCINAEVHSVDLGCVSADCPIFYKRMSFFSDINRLSQLRKVLKDELF